MLNIKANKNVARANEYFDTNETFDTFGTSIFNNVCYVHLSNCINTQTSMLMQTGHTEINIHYTANKQQLTAQQCYAQMLQNGNFAMLHTTKAIKLIASIV